ncbi:hypothetical protein SAVCW2_51960 [Streptomyces avermitilis]|nr:hypothetical protein SAVCW2_51960 [Streptomyces avermitilis]
MQAAKLPVNTGCLAPFSVPERVIGSVQAPRGLHAHGAPSVSPIGPPGVIHATGWRQPHIENTPVCHVLEAQVIEGDPPAAPFTSRAPGAQEVPVQPLGDAVEP